MKIEEIRPSFSVYLIASDLAKYDGIAESLGLAGYMVARFSELAAAFSEFPSNPPHFILFDAEETTFQLKKALRQVSAQLPESHIFLLTSPEARERAVALYEYGVYDLIYLPVISQTELVRCLDRAAERDYFMYLNERLQSQGTSIPLNEDSPESTGPSASPLARQLFQQRTSDEAIMAFLRATSERLGHCGAVFFKYISNRRVLLASAGHNLGETEWNGLGVDFNTQGIRTTHLRDPDKMAELGELARDVFESNNYFCLPVEALGEVQGIAMFLAPRPNDQVYSLIEDDLHLLGRALSLQEAEKRLHVLTIKDPATELLNRQNFIGRIDHEISRSRRTTMPVSLALLAVDQYGQIVSQVGHEEAQTVLRVVARIFEKHSRVNDIIGRTGADEFGIILPHTGKQGALVKAERLRRIIESADFSRVIKEFPKLTLSIGVSEYPSMARDAEELIQSADEALFQVRGIGNKTCVAKPPEGFVPDFKVPEKRSTTN